MKLAFSNKYSQPSGLHCIWQRNETNYNCCCFFVFFSPHRRREVFLTVSGCGGAALLCCAVLRVGQRWAGAVSWGQEVCDVVNQTLRAQWFTITSRTALTVLQSLYEMWLRNFNRLLFNILKRSKNQHLHNTYLARQTSGVFVFVCYDRTHVNLGPLPLHTHARLHLMIRY